MAAPYDLNDDSVVVVIGSGAGGGTLGTNWRMKGIDTVILEAGGRHEIEDFLNDEWGSFRPALLARHRAPRREAGGWRRIFRACRPGS